MPINAGNIKYGAPWKDRLEIREFEPGRLVADVSLVGAKWTWPTVWISVGIAILLGIASVLAWEPDPARMGGSITIGFFALLALFVSGVALGCVSYRARLEMDEKFALFERTFFWKFRRFEQQRGGQEALQCWRHSKGSGGDKSYEYALCLHLSEDFPVICLFSLNFVSALRKKILGAIGMEGRTELPTAEEALQQISDKADEIAAALGGMINRNLEKSAMSKKLSESKRTGATMKAIALSVSLVATGVLVSFLFLGNRWLIFLGNILTIFGAIIGLSAFLGLLMKAREKSKK